MSKFSSLRKEYATTSAAKKFIPEKFRTGIAEEEAKAPYFMLAPYGISNKRWSTVQNSINKKTKEKLDAGKLSNEEARKVTLDTFLAACVEGWGNIPDATAPIAFSPAEARELFDDPTMSELYIEALEWARDMGNFLEAEAKDAVGNS